MQTYVFCSSITKVMLSSYCFLTGDIWFWFDLLLVVLTEITWLKWCLLGFSTLELHIFHLWLTSILWGYTLRLCKYPSSNILPLVLVSIDVSRLSEVLRLPNGIFSFHHSFHNHQLAFHPTHVFIPISIKMHGYLFYSMDYNQLL